MEHVYILNHNKDDIFSSLLMNGFRELEVGFSNMDNTEYINYHNILIYIPRVGSNDHYNIIRSDIINNVFKFKYKLMLFVTEDDYIITRSTIESMLGKYRFKYYQSIAFDTGFAKIIVDDCHKLLNGKFRFYNTINR